MLNQANPSQQQDIFASVEKIIGQPMSEDQSHLLKKILDPSFYVPFACARQSGVSTLIRAVAIHAATVEKENIAIIYPNFQSLRVHLDKFVDTIETHGIENPVIEIAGAGNTRTCRFKESIVMFFSEKASEKYRDLSNFLGFRDNFLNFDPDNSLLSFAAPFYKFVDAITR